MIKRIRFGGDPAPGAVRATICEPLPGFGDCPWDRLVTEWFTAIPEPVPGALLAEESVLRGSRWLSRRWETGGERLKHMALAVRAGGLTRAEFSRRWRAHAGTAGGTPIPDPARGLAYVQNHVVSGDLDAVNEVWFDDLDGLRARVAWFADNPVRPGALFGESRFVSVREIVTA